MAAISKVRMLLDGVYGQRFLNQIGSPAALVSSRKLAVHGSWAEYDKKKEEEEAADKALRRSVLQMNLDLLDLASDAKSDKHRVTGLDGKTSGVTGGKAAAADASAGEAGHDSYMQKAIRSPQTPLQRGGVPGFRDLRPIAAGVSSWTSLQLVPWGLAGHDS